MMNSAQERVMGFREMNQPMVTQSRFFTSEFNTAIIDGPLRIYFSDRQESHALQIYFGIQELLEKEGQPLSRFAQLDNYLFLMLYPTDETFFEIFEKNEDWVTDRFGQHKILGIKSAHFGHVMPEISRQIRNHLKLA